MKISGYTTTRNCIELDYPFQKSIRSMLEFCDEVVIADSSDSDDGTIEALQELMDEFSQVNVVHVDVDYTAPNFGVWDGKMKAIARDHCTGDYLWQFDVDEIAVDARKSVVNGGIRGYLEMYVEKVFQKDPQKKLASFPVVEFWGSEGKVRVDVNPWKWRFSVNDPNITHGIPKHLRRYKDGLLYAAHGTDGCDYITKDTGEVVPCSHFFTSPVEILRRTALNGDEKSLALYEEWFNDAIDMMPSIHHYSWHSVESKIHKWKKYWNRFWNSLYNESRDEDWNPFFDQPLDTVTDEQIALYAEVIEKYSGGHIFHTRWNFTRTPHIRIDEREKS